MILKNMLQLYTLLICAISVIILLVVSGLSLNSFVNLLLPEYTNYSTLGRYESNEAYIRSREQQYNYNREEVRQEIMALRQLSPQTLTEQRLTARKDFLEDQRRRNIQDLIIYFEWAFVSLLFFYIHWRLYRKSAGNSEG